MGTRVGGIRAAALLLAGLVSAIPGLASAYEAADSDAVFLGTGSSNIEVRDSDELLSGSNVFGGARIGLFWTLFVELGYGAIDFSDRVLVSGVKKRIDFRTTGGFYGVGIMLPIRNLALGVKATQSFDNKWSQEITDVTTNTVDSRTSGNIDYNSYFAFVRIGRFFELGARRDEIKNTDSVVTNAFGPYVALNIPLGFGPGHMMR
ncbi:MAG: hypothetical protein HY423_03060 [Candidatus Lambdaproteobacteria bacterium]|nr:hypothetical protein [Candidatus Lambdaproteobacteria bacterium]